MFLSTPPVWVATGLFAILPIYPFVSIHATRVGGDQGTGEPPGGGPAEVSIHATRVGGDSKRTKKPLVS